MKTKAKIGLIILKRFNFIIEILQKKFVFLQNISLRLQPYVYKSK